MPARILTSLLLICCAVLPSIIEAQDVPILKPRPGEVPILAIADVQPAGADKGADLSETIRTFNQVLWDDLSFAGIFTITGKSFYPPQPLIRPDELNYEAWAAIPFNVTYVTAGTMERVGGLLRAELRIFDVKSRTMSFGQRISGDPAQVRAMAHRWADEIVYRLTAGASRGIASTKIAYTLRKGNAKEIIVADYDGHNPRPFTNNGSLNLFPNWSPDNSKLAFISYRTGKPEINIHSYLDGSRASFPEFNAFVNTPAISPDGTEVAFVLRSSRGDADLFVSRLDGSNRRNLSNNPAIETSPTWSPSGRQIAFVSDRSHTGLGQIYICDSDGSNVRRIVKEGGDADSPSWSPDGKWIAFHWKPTMGTYDIYLAEAAGGRIFQLTTGGGSNPAWAPDGRHIAFQSNRTGSNQLYIMLLDGSELRMITRQGNNSTPAWSGYFRRESEK